MNETAYYIITFGLLILSVLIVSGVLLFVGRERKS